MKAFRMSFFIALAVTVLIALLWPAPAGSQIAVLPMLCGPTENIIAMLKNKHDEQMIGRGSTRSGELVQLYVSEKSFTVLITLRDGTSCMAAAGDIWKTLIRGQST